MGRDFLTITMNDGNRKFPIWNSKDETFEVHNENDKWDTWSEFEKDLKTTLYKKGIEFGDSSYEDGDRVVREYENSIPTHVKTLNQPIKTAEEEEISIISFVLAGAAILFILYLGGAGIWDSAIKPALGYFGVIEYKSKSLLRYESFLDKASGCQEMKKVYSEKSLKYPVFHIFQCRNGEEVIWKYKVEVIRKANDSRWILD